MKQLTLTLLFIAISLTGFSQSHTDHDAVMEKFRRFYNAKLSDSIQTLFPEPSRIWDQGNTNEVFKEYGAIQSVKYIGEMDDDPDTKLYKITSEKKTFALGLSLDKRKKLENFRFHTSSDYINKLLKENE